MPRQKGDRDLPEALRGGILALHVFSNMDYPEISRILKVHPSTAESICKKAEVKTDRNYQLLILINGNRSEFLMKTYHLIMKRME